MNKKDSKDKSLFNNLLKKIPSETQRFVDKQIATAVKINDLRKKNKMSQKQLAEELNMNESQLSRILAGNENLTLKTIAKIEDVFNEDVISIDTIEQETVTISTPRFPAYFNFYHNLTTEGSTGTDFKDDKMEYAEQKVSANQYNIGQMN